MDRAEADNHYTIARKLGQKEYSRSVSKGMTGYLPVLEGILKNIEIIYEIDLGVVEIPLKKIVGTYTNARSRSFAVNFHAADDPEDGVCGKMDSFVRSTSEEGIRDPIKVYEYLNWFYVVEGTKGSAS